jgi:hypothetical protein
MKNILLLTTLFLFSSLASAAAPKASDFEFTLKEVPMDQEAQFMVQQFNPTIGEILVMTKDIIALGEKIYEVVKKGRPTSTTEYAPIHVIPVDSSTKTHIDPFELELVKEPVVKKYSLQIKNKLNMTVLNFSFVLFFEPGGSYQGKGKYILNAMLIPSTHVAYGFDFDAKMELQGIANRGTKADPLASATLTLTLNLESVAANLEKIYLIHIDGLGKVIVK